MNIKKFIFAGFLTNAIAKSFRGLNDEEISILPPTKPLSNTNLPPEDRWFSSNQKYSLSVKKMDNATSQAIHQFHHIDSSLPVFSLDYSFQGGSGASDVCVNYTPHSLECLPGEKVQFDETFQKAVLHLPFIGTSTAYFLNAPSDPLLGIWIYTNNEMKYILEISQGSVENGYDINDETFFPDGRRQCAMYPDVHYQAYKNEDGTMTLKHERPSSYKTYSFIYDPKEDRLRPDASKPINWGRTHYSMGECTEYITDVNATFLKE